MQANRSRLVRTTLRINNAEKTKEKKREREPSLTLRRWLLKSKTTHANYSFTSWLLEMLLVFLIHLTVKVFSLSLFFLSIIILSV